MKPFAKEEIIDVIWSMEPDKSPRPDGFSFHFYRFCWTVIIKDLLKMIQAFQSKAKVGSGIYYIPWKVIMSLYYVGSCLQSYVKE